MENFDLTVFIKNFGGAVGSALILAVLLVQVFFGYVKGDKNQNHSEIKKMRKETTDRLDSLFGT